MAEQTKTRTRKPKEEKVDEIKVKGVGILSTEQVEKKAAKTEKKAAKKLKAEKEANITTTLPKTHISNKKKKEPTVKFNEPAEGKVEFRKVGRGSLRKIPGCQPIIKPGEKFLAYPDQIPVSFRNSVVRTDQQKASFEKDIQSVDMVYRIKKLQNGLYNVVNKRAKKMNPKPLSREDAIALRNDLND